MDDNKKESTNGWGTFERIETVDKNGKAQFDGYELTATIYIDNPKYIEVKRGRRSAEAEAAEDTRTWEQKRKRLQMRYTKRVPAKDANTDAKAGKILKKWLADLESAPPATPESKQDENPISVPDYVCSYIENKAGVQKSTKTSYRTSLKHIENRFAGVPLTALDRSQVQEWVNWMREEGGKKPKKTADDDEEGIKEVKGLAYNTTLKAYRLLSQACKEAVNRDDILKNPCSGVKVPKEQRKRPNALVGDMPKQAARLLLGMPQTPQSIAALLALYTGMRIGEVCGLKWESVDFEHQTIDVCNAIGTADDGDYEKDPKSDSSIRVLDMPDTLKNVLEQWRGSKMADLEEAGVVTQWRKLAKTDKAAAIMIQKKFGTLFVIGDLKGRFANKNIITRKWKAISESHGLIGSNGVPVTFHDLRHTYATVAANNGINFKVLQEIMGHSSIQVTLDLYAVADPAAKKAVAVKIDELLR